MAADRILRARVEAEFANRVEAYAREQGSDVSETIRRALTLLLEEEERRARAERALAAFRESVRQGLYDPPTGIWKAGGFK